MVTDEPDAVITTHALGSCVAVCLWDPVSRVGGLLHYLLPDAKVNPERARVQPASFADSGIPLLFRSAYAKGLDKGRAKVCLVGGAETTVVTAGALNVGKRNVLAARNLLWRNGVMLKGECVGGHIPRTVSLRVSDGVIDVTSGRELIQTL